jgi:hypothetical protein
MRSRKPRAIDFKSLEPPAGFRNINELGNLEGAEWLHPVQSLFGDWNAKNLILGQDFNSWNNIRNVDPRDLKHDPNFETNKNLTSIFGGSSALYANYCWFIKEGKNASAALSLRQEVRKANEPIFFATVQSMEELQNIFCLGSKVSRAVFGGPRETLANEQTVIFGRKLLIHSLPHPGALGIANFCRSKKTDKKSVLQLLKQYVNIYAN